MARNSRLLLPLLAGVLTVGGCESSSLAGSGSTRLTIQLTDAPGDVEQAWVQIRQIYLQGDSGRITLNEGAPDFHDLLTLANGATAALVAGAVIPSGRYSQLRFVIGDAYIVTDGGKVYATNQSIVPDTVKDGAEIGTLECPSCESSGLKVKFPEGGLTLEEGEEIVVVDFDVSQSFGRAAGNSGKWVMRPVLQVTKLEASGDIMGTVTLASGVALPACGGQATDLSKSVPTATAGEIVKTGTTNQDGKFVISFAAPGTYTLGAAPVAFDNQDTLYLTAAATPARVTVVSGSEATAAYRVTAASCKVKAGG